jgi:hypothetical protein
MTTLSFSPLANLSSISQNFFSPSTMKKSNKLECLSPASLSCLVCHFRAEPFSQFLLRQAPCFNYKYYIRLERLARDNHAGLLRLFISEGDKKKFYNIGNRLQGTKSFQAIDYLSQSTYTSSCLSC